MVPFPQARTPLRAARRRRAARAGGERVRAGRGRVAGRDDRGVGSGCVLPGQPGGRAGGLGGGGGRGGGAGVVVAGGGRARGGAGGRGRGPRGGMEELFWRVAGPLAGGSGGDDDDGGRVLVLGGMPVCGIDGMLIALADTPPNRAMFGCTGTRRQKGPGSALFPQLLAGGATARAGRGKVGGRTRQAQAGEQTPAARASARPP